MNLRAARQKWLPCLVLASISASCAGAPEKQENSNWLFFDPPEQISDTNWELTYEENFDSLDLDKYETRYIWPREEIINGEEQFYIDPVLHGVSPFEIDQGVLKIKAQRTPASLMQTTSQRYVSGVLTSREEFSQLYGRFEIRAKMPAGEGLWPAFWLLPTHETWPEGVAMLPELDVMEFIAQEETWYHTTLHSNVTGQSQSVGDDISTNANLSDGFHDYAATWGPEKIAWYFDGEKVFKTETPQDFNHPKHFLLNLAVGGNWAGSPSAATNFPASFEIDHVKVFQYENIASSSDDMQLETPTNLHNVVYSENTAELFWSRGDNYPSDVVFDVYKNLEYFESTTGRSVFLENITPGSSNRFHVVAKASSYVESYPAMTTVESLGNIPYATQPPQAPRELFGVYVPENGVLLRWESPGEVDHYEVWRGESLVKLTDMPLYLDEDIAPGDTFTYQVYAVAANGGRSGSSNLWSTAVSDN